MNPRREFTTAAVLCALGAGTAVVAGGRSWATVRATDTITPLSQHVTGRELTAVALALGWAGLAGLAALFATRGRVRAAVGGLLAIFGAGIAYASATAMGTANVLRAAGDKSPMLRLDGDALVRPSAWWIVSLAGGALLAAAGVMVLLRGARWPGMSARYETDGAAKARVGTPAGPSPAGGTSRAGTDDPSTLWKSLDRGEDPTITPANREDGAAREKEEH
ncbi:Trp biosynthesis-associated membrane protein [Actinomadura sp. HBU206391]|uniref:Trp biosynthesis-associated membrane protein n=1 Tax=Actinomadura sp. HBU206391 TaxID=2731692 RepID=UPI0016503F55|nr:Trp biosynthesis-associated membrane protein [Actinomadura sp. HBU206391]MBC6463800.1 Trp biosynthesis-associated membrane protein [Actinomadura sp. HBU206391]